MTSLPLSAEGKVLPSVDFTPEVKGFFLGEFKQTVTAIKAKAYLLPQIEILANDEEVVNGLAERIQRGSKADVRLYVDEHFAKFPFGLKTNVVFCLLERFKEWHKYQKLRKTTWNNDVAELFSNEFCGDILKKWKTGFFNPSELYDVISSAVTNDLLEPQLAKRMVQLTLQDSGYVRTDNDRADFDKTKRFRADVKGFNLLDLQNVVNTIDGCEIELISSEGITSNISSTKHTAVVNKSHPSVHNMTTKGREITWSHERSADHLFFLQPEIAGGRQHLVIGGNLKFERGDLDTENIIGVDISPRSSCDDTLSITILAQGQWLGDLDRSTKGTSDDGASEEGGNDDDDNISICSGDDEQLSWMNRGSGATQTVKRRYYCLFLSVINDAVIVRYVTPIHRSFLLDQHPTMILSLCPLFAIVGGTNGLLGLVDSRVLPLYCSSAPFSSSSYHMNQSASCSDESSTSSIFDEASLIQSSSSSTSNGKVNFGCVVTLKGGSDKRNTELTTLGEGGMSRDDIESMKGEEHPHSFISLTVDSLSKEHLHHIDETLSSQQQIASPGPFPFLTRIQAPFHKYTFVEPDFTHSVPMDGDDDQASHKSTQSNIPPIVTHAADACITALSYSGEESSVFASGDSNGCVCLWRLEESSDSIDSLDEWSEDETILTYRKVPHLVAKPIQIAGDGGSGSILKTSSKGSRINSLFISPSGRHVAVGLHDRLLLVAVGLTNYEEQQESSTLPSLYVRSSLDIITGCRAVYSVVFRSLQMHIWRITDTPQPHLPNDSFRLRRGGLEGDEEDLFMMDSRDPRPYPYSGQGNQTHYRGLSSSSLRNSNGNYSNHRFPNVLSRSFTPSTATSRTSSLFPPLSAPTSPVSCGSTYQPQQPWLSSRLPSGGGGGGRRRMLSQDYSNTIMGDGKIGERFDSKIEKCDENVGVTVTSWLHPNVDCFETRFGMDWNDRTFYDDDLGEGRKKNINKEVSIEDKIKKRRHSLVSTPNTSGKNGHITSEIQTARHGLLKPLSHSHSISASFSGKSDREEEIGIADSSRYSRKFTEIDPVQKKTYMCKRLSLQTCSHPVRSPSPTLTGSRSRRRKATAGNVIDGNDNMIAASASFDAETDHSAGDDSEESDIELEPSALDFYVPQNVQEISLQFDSQSTITTLNTTMLDTLSNVFSDARARMSKNVHLTAPSAATTTDNTHFLCSPPLHETPDNLPDSTSSVPRPAAIIFLKDTPRSSSDLFDCAQMILSTADYDTLCLHAKLSETETAPMDSSIMFQKGTESAKTGYFYMKTMAKLFKHEGSSEFLKVKRILAIFCAALQPPSANLIAAALEEEISKAAVVGTFLHTLPLFFDLKTDGDMIDDAEWGKAVIVLTEEFTALSKWLTSTAPERIGKEFWIDVSIGHNYLCALYLKYCGNKSVAVEHPWQEYLKIHGPFHLRRSSRGLRLLTSQIRKIDETANIKGTLPRQLGFIVGLQEIYARRVGLVGRLPNELGELDQLRVLSMGNNQLCGELPDSLGRLKHLQRIVLHQNKLAGHVPASLGKLGCIVNLAGNVGLEHGADVPHNERQALEAFFDATKGSEWTAKHHWRSKEPVSRWYKVGVLLSHVHSIVMSSNSMVGYLPAELEQLTHLRMIELATMNGLVGPIPTQLCSLTTLRRLCICRCGLTGEIPKEIGQLVGLEELQLFGNHLSGIIPASLGNLTELKLLSLGEYTGGNDFKPMPLPACFGSLKNLEALFMANCHLRGPLPPWIEKLTELRQLDLQHNSLSGTIPKEIGKLQNLLYLNVKDNERLDGPLPVAEMATLTKLNRLSLVHCNFERAEEAVAQLQMHLPRCKIWL